MNAEAVAAVLLAAGRSSRMGFPKMVADLDGQPLVRRTAETFLAAGVAEVVVSRDRRGVPPPGNCYGILEENPETAPAAPLAGLSLEAST